jgi:hypothetical protein
MSCEPIRPCGPGPAGLGLVSPLPGERRLTRRIGEFHGFLHELIADTERERVGDRPLGSSWDIEGDPNGLTLAKLWAFVAEGVAAYTELTAGEAYLATAADWTDLRRLANLVGYRPQPRIAAQGWVEVETDKGASPLVPAGTRVQAPGTPTREAQTFEVVEDAQLRAEWAGLTATLVPVAATPAAPDQRKVRFLGDPGFRQGDRVLFLAEETAPPTITTWFDFWVWLLTVWLNAESSATGLAIASIVDRKDELGTSLVEFDRDLDAVLDSIAEPYVAYRIRATAGAARRVEKVLRIPATGPTVEPLSIGSGTPFDLSGTFVVLDAALEDVSAGQLVAVVDWQSKKCDVASVSAHRPQNWEVTPGTSIRVSRLEFAQPGLGTLKVAGGPITVYVLDRRIVAKHYVFPPSGSPSPTQLRLFPAPEVPPERIALQTEQAGVPTWETFACAKADDLYQEETGIGDAARGLTVDLLDGAVQGSFTEAPATGNVARVRHGTTKTVVLGSGDAASAGQRLPVPDAPVAYDLDASGNPVPNQVLRVDGVQWQEVPALYGAGPAQVFAVRLGEEGSVVDEFGDGTQGARLPSGRGNVAATYRIGGGTVGEVSAGEISSLLGSVRGVKKVAGAGPTSGGADQDDESRMRRLAPGRARAFGRAVSLEDLADLALGYPGVSHAAAWVGPGPPGCACGHVGIHLAFLRDSADGPRAPLGTEIDSLAAYVDGRRDTSVPLCVCAGAATAVTVTATLAVDPRRVAADVATAAGDALLDPHGPLAPLQRSLGQPLDRSDVVVVLHGVVGVVGVPSLTLPGSTGDLGRRAAARYELLTLAADASVQGVAA